METKQFLKKLCLLFFESGFTQRVLLPFKNTIIWINLLKYNNILKKYNKSTKNIKYNSQYLLKYAFKRADLHF